MEMREESFIYYDESKHCEAGFYLGAYVYSQNGLNDIISEYIQQSGLNPDKDEFKSSSKMKDNPKLKELRGYLKNLIQNVKIFIVVSQPNPEDFRLATKYGLLALMENNQDELTKYQKVYLDEGIFNNKNDKSIDRLLIENGIHSDKFCIKIEQNSMIIKGIQLSDLVAHTCSIMLKEQLGLINKTIKAGENSGYDPDIEINIGVELWANVRWHYFAYPPPHPDNWKDGSDFVVELGNRGLYVSDNCSNEIKKASYERFGKMYLGCIH